MNLLCMRKQMEEMLSYIELNNEEIGHDCLWFYVFEYTRISIFTIFDFLVSYTQSSLFSCVAVTASGKQKQQWLFLYEDPIASVICFSLPGNFTTLHSLSYSLFSIGTRFLFFLHGKQFSSPFYISPEFRFSELPA